MGFARRGAKSRRKAIRVILSSDGRTRAAHGAAGSTNRSEPRALRLPQPTDRTPLTPSPRHASVAQRIDSLLKRLEDALADLDEVPLLDSERYSATHAVFESRSDQRQRIIDWLLARTSSVESAERPVRVLGIGCGAGEVDVAVARGLGSDAETLEYVGVDPNRSQADSFKEAFAEAELPGVRVEVEIGPFEDFRSAEDFDLVHFVHSLYYMPDPAEALKRARSSLAADGKLIFVHAPLEELNDLAVRFYDKNYERPTLFANDFSRLLESWNWSFERTRLEARIDVTPFIEDEPGSGAALRDFIVQVDVASLPPSVRELVESYLRLISFRSGDRSFISHPVDAFVVTA